MAEEGFSVNDFEALEEARRGVVWGIYDTQDNCWIGTENGPRLFKREEFEDVIGGIVTLAILAKIAAQMAGVQIGYAPGRLQAREFDGENLRLKDQVPTKMTSLEALTKLETGT